MHRYTPEEKAFFIQYVAGHSHKEIQSEFIRRFGWEITMGQIVSFIGNNKLNTGRDGRFTKGQIPANKGKKFSPPGSEKGWFTKGRPPINHRPVGSERISKGYVQIKTAEPNKWELKHRAVWKKHYGDILKGHIIIFLDGDKTNCNIENLMAIKRSTNMILNHTDLHKHTGQLKETAAYIAELKVAAGHAKKGLQ